jgi:ABC-2 type transport system ATP-binding protein
LESLTAAVADGGLSVVVSSHLLHDLERVCDHLILLSASRTQLCGTIDELIAAHRSLLGPRRGLNEIEPGPHGYQGDPKNQTDSPSRAVERSDP